MVFRRGKTISLREVAQLGGAEFKGIDARIRGFDKLRRLRYRSPILTYALDKHHFLQAMLDTNVLGVVVAPELLSSLATAPSVSKGFIVHDDPVSCFFGTHNRLSRESKLYFPSRPRTRIGNEVEIHRSAHIEEGAIIGDRVDIGAHVYVGPRVRLGPGTRVMANSVLGVDAVEVKRIDGKESHVTHVGGVTIGPRARISPSVVVSNALFHGSTRVAADATIGEFSHISHGVQIGNHSFLTAGVLTGGYSSIGANCVIGLGVSIKQFVRIGKGASVSMGVAVVKDVPSGTTVNGVYGKDSRVWREEQLAMSRLLKRGR